MARRKRRRSTGTEAGGARTVAEPLGLVSWRDRTQQVLRALRDYSRQRQGGAIEEYLRRRFGEPSEVPLDVDLERAFDDFVCAEGTAGDARSLVLAFAEEDADLAPEERESLRRWPTERTRRVCLLDRAYRERLDLWDPVRAARVPLQLLERLPAARAAELVRGSVVIALSAPWGHRLVALGAVEFYEDDEAATLYRREVLQSDRVWHDLPVPAPNR
jgi:hypothetical protein